MTALHALEAEQAILGAAVDDARVVDRLTLRAEHFYDPTHAALWTELTERRRTDRLADLVSLREWADRHFAEIGGAGYLRRLVAQSIGASLYLDGYAEQIRDVRRRRDVVDAAKGAIATATVGEVDALTALEQRLQEIAAGDTDADAWESLGSVCADAAETAELGEAKGIGTGFEKLDAATGGIQPGTLWVAGGATAMGKSVFGSALSRNIAAQGFGVGEVHLEMDRLQVGIRADTALAFDRSHRVDSPHYLSALQNRLTPVQWDAVRSGARSGAKLPIYVDARPGRSLSQIEAAARRLFRKMQREGVKPGALIVDHEGLIASEQRHPSQLEAANARACGLLTMAKRLGVAIIALSQITKEGSRADGEERLPTALDLNYGSALSQAASVVILLHRKAYYAERKPENLRTDKDWDALKSRECTLVVDKSRAGRRAQITVWMDMPTAAVWEDTA